MRKEVILAIAIGFSLGLVITFGIWTANKSLKNQGLDRPLPTPTAQTVSSSPPPAGEPSPVSNFPLSVSSPEDEALFNTSKITLTGKTAAAATVAVAFEDSQTIVSADANGDFTAAVNLVGGYNVIRVTAFDTAGNRAEQLLTVTYTTTKI